MADRGAQKITQKLIDGLEPETNDYIQYDSDVRGFGVRVTPNRVKSFILNYRINRRVRRVTIGRCDEWSVTGARKEAETLRGKINDGFDPLQESDAECGAPSFAELTKEYLEAAHTHKRPATLRNDRSMIDSILLPQLGRHKVADIHRQDLERIHRNLKPTKYRANRVLALVSAIFSWAMRDEHSQQQWGVTANPAHGIERYHEDKREVWLSQDQLDNLERALAAYRNPEAADAIRLLILTGSRESEVLEAEWGQFDLERGIWTKPSHHTKQKKTE